MAESYPAAPQGPRPDGPPEPARLPLQVPTEVTGYRAWLIPVVGVVFVILLVLGFVLVSGAPGSGADGRDVIGYYGANHDRALASALARAVSVPAGLVFFALLREYVDRSPAGRVWGVVALLGAGVLSASSAVAAGMTLSLVDVTDHLTPGAAQALNVLGNDLATGLLIGGLSATQFGFGLAFLAGRMFARWLGWLTLAIAVVALLGPLAFFALAAGAVWVLVVAGELYTRRA